MIYDIYIYIYQVYMYIYNMNNNIFTTARYNESNYLDISDLTCISVAKTSFKENITIHARIT